MWKVDVGVREKRAQDPIPSSVEASTVDRETKGLFPRVRDGVLGKLVEEEAEVMGAGGSRQDILFSDES